MPQACMLSIAFDNGEVNATSFVNLSQEASQWDTQVYMLTTELVADSQADQAWSS